MVIKRRLDNSADLHRGTSLYKLELFYLGILPLNLVYLLRVNTFERIDLSTRKFDGG
jgi:hypothetical protein